MFRLLLDMGFSTHEERVYRFCVQHSHTSPTEIARGTKLPRSTVYMCIDSLIERGFLVTKTTGRRRNISAVAPRKAFETYLRSEKQRVRQQEKQIHSLIVELTTLPKEVATRTSLTHYEDRNGVVHMIDCVVKEKADIYWIGTLEPLLQTVGEETLFSRLTRKRYNQHTVSYAITTRAILTNKLFGAPLRGFREYRFVDTDMRFPGLLVVCGNTVALLSAPGGVANVVIIQDKTIATMIHSVYKLLWTLLPAPTH